MAAIFRRLWKNEYFKTAVTIALIPLLVAGFWFGLQAALNTKIFPLLTVTSESMCIPEVPCDGWSHPFERTLHVGDLLIIQGVDGESLNADYPNSDVIVFQNPSVPVDDPHANIVHRIISVEKVNGTLYFHTKGDGNGWPNVWPNAVTRGEDYWSSASYPDSTYDGAISEDYVYGKVIMRIPWVGSLSILAQEYTVIPIILVLIIIILIVIEFVLPLFKKGNTQAAPKTD